MTVRSRFVDCALVGFAIAVRVAAVLVLQSHDVPRSTYEHGEIAANLLAGRGFSMHFLGADGPTSQQAPVYPAIVALAYWIGGVETPQALLLLEFGQALLGGVLVLGVIRLARTDCPGPTLDRLGRRSHCCDPPHSGLLRDSCASRRPGCDAAYVDDGPSLPDWCERTRQ